MSVQAVLRRATGLAVSRAAADRAVRERMEATGEVNRERYLAQLAPAELNELVELVVVPESWLFRDPQAFQLAVEVVQAKLARHAAAGLPQRAVRILSVPCAGGEEPYSMAMALSDAGVPRSGFSIDAYDLSPRCVARARSGVYGRNAFRTQDLAFRERYFTSMGDDCYRIDEAIRTQVRVEQGNLLELDTEHGGRRYDIIFCRNLLIYFDKPTTEAAIERLSALLADDGILFAGYAEVPAFTRHGYTPLPYRHAFALKKDPPQPAQPAAQQPAQPLPPGRGARAAALRTAAPLSPATPATRAASATRSAPAAPAAPATRAAPAASAAPTIEELLAQARKLADRGENREAAAACQAVLAAAPETADAYFMLGMLSEQAGQAAQAEQHWRRCIYLQPDHYEALCHLALLAEQGGDSNGAAALKARAARIYQRRQQESQQESQPGARPTQRMKAE